MICNLCGTENKDGSKFCKNCGQNLEQAEKKEWEMEKSDAPSGQSVTMDQSTGEGQNQTAGSGVDLNKGQGVRQMKMTGRSSTIRQSMAPNLRDRRGRAIQPPV